MAIGRESPIGFIRCPVSIGTSMVEAAGRAWLIIIRKQHSDVLKLLLCEEGVAGRCGEEFFFEFKEEGLLFTAEVAEDAISRPNAVKVAIEAGCPICAVGEGRRGFQAL